MSKSIEVDSQHYSELVARQVEQYKETEVMHDLPPIMDYWSHKYYIPKSKPVCGIDNLVSFYASHFQQSLEASNSPFLISIGSGDSSIEIAIVKELIQKKVKNFFFICLELSPVLIEKARKKIDEEKLGDIITAACVDINSWNPNFSFAGVMAHHSLHHILELELLFNIIKKNLAPKGLFITADMIGRNGHMRWPEALQFIRQAWSKLPIKYKYHHQLKKFDYYFDNWDCAAEGFEGIRAQDILPLLVKNFSFEKFFPSGGLIDIFVDRGFGPNFDPSNPDDTAFIDLIEEANDQLISDGILTPTTMLAVMSNEQDVSTHVYKNWTPAFCVRDPLKSSPVYDPSSYIERINFSATTTNEIKREDYRLETTLHFSGSKSSIGNSTPGLSFLTYGWCSPDNDFTWTSCEDAALLIPLARVNKKNLTVHLELLIYHSPIYKNAIVEIYVDNNLKTTLTPENKLGELVSHAKLAIPFEVKNINYNTEIKFVVPHRRQPQYEDGADVRCIGIALTSLKIV